MLQKIVIADDDALTRERHKRIIEEACYETIEAKEGEEAFNHIKAGGIALLVTDLDMPPGWDGYSLIQRLSEDHYTIPILVIAGWDGFDQSLVKDYSGRIEHLEKPIIEDSIISDKVRQMLTTP